jgi:hypothetical protein
MRSEYKAFDLAAKVPANYVEKTERFNLKDHKKI